MKKLALALSIVGVVFVVLSLWVSIPLAVGVICIGASVIIDAAHE